jgi:hypothetical protein
LTILDLATRWKRVVRFTLRPLYAQARSSEYPLGRRLGESREKPYTCLELNLGRPAHSQSLYPLAYEFEKWLG